MELNIIIEGEHPEAAERAGVLAVQLAKRAITRIEMNVDKTADEAYKQLGRGRMQPDVAVVYSCDNSTLLLNAVDAVKRLREKLGTEVHAIFVCTEGAVCLTKYEPNRPAFKGDLSPYAGGVAKLKETIDHITPEDVAAMAERWRDTFPTMRDFLLNSTEAEYEEFQDWRISRGYAKASPEQVVYGNAFKPILIEAPKFTDDAERLKFQEELSAAFNGHAPVVFATDASMQVVPLNYDLGKDSFTAANLVVDGHVQVEARNVYHFSGRLRLGNGKREHCPMLFELAEVVPVSGLHVAVDKFNTHYFATGHFPKRAFSFNKCRPATADETLEYLNAKLKYQNEKAN